MRERERRAREEREKGEGRGTRRIQARRRELGAFLSSKRLSFPVALLTFFLISAVVLLLGHGRRRVEHEREARTRHTERARPVCL